jgi:3-mercaptopyruvate sulfurtransferase SseA
LAGYPQVRNYIGSWHEWSARPELPLERGHRQSR